MNEILLTGEKYELAECEDRTLSIGYTLESSEIQYKLRCVANNQNFNAIILSRFYGS